MESVHYYFDESGEKGLLDGNFSPSDIGLIAGIALPARLVPIFNGEISIILKKLDLSDVKKLHASELFKDGKNAPIRHELLNFLASKNEWLLVYEAVFPLGLYNSEVSTQQLLQRPNPTNQSVRVSRNQHIKRIYIAMLEGIIIKLDEVCRNEHSHDLLMVSDQIDNGILKEALETLNHLKQDTHVHKSSGYDTATGQIVHGSIESSIKGFDAKVKYVSDIKIDSTQSSLTVAADIVTNSLYRHLMQVVKKTPSLRLHSNAAVADFILKDKTAFTDDCYIMDTLYLPNSEK